MVQRAIEEALISNFQHFVGNSHATAVIASAFTHSNGTEQILLARAFVSAEGVLPWMACTRKGSPIVKEVFNVLEGTELEVAYKQLMSDRACKSRYGRSVVRAIENCGDAIASSGGLLRCDSVSDVEESLDFEIHVQL